jgi:hypothetical protein
MADQHTSDYAGRFHFRCQAHERFAINQALIPLIITPRIICCWAKKKTMIMGMTIRKDMAIISGIWVDIGNLEL